MMTSFEVSKANEVQRTGRVLDPFMYLNFFYNLSPSSLSTLSPLFHLSLPSPCYPCIPPPRSLSHEL